MTLHINTYKLFYGLSNNLTTITDTPSQTSYSHELEMDASSAYCGDCFCPIEGALDDDARLFFSRDLFCQCGRRS